MPTHEIKGASRGMSVVNILKGAKMRNASAQGENNADMELQQCVAANSVECRIYCGHAEQAIRQPAFMRGGQLSLALIN